MHIKLIPFLFVALLFAGCSEDLPEETEGEKTTKVAEDEFDGIEVLFDEAEFSDPKSAELLREINICSDSQIDANGNVTVPCSPELFKLFPLKEGVPLSDGFVLLVKAETNGVALRRVLVFERENGTLVKVNGFIANIIGKRKKKDTNDDLLLRFIDKIEGSDVFYHCIFSWEDGKYAFKTVEVIHEPAGNFYGRVKESVKDSVSKDIYKILDDNKMIF